MKKVISIISFCLLLQCSFAFVARNENAFGMADITLQEAFLLKVVVTDSLKAKGIREDRDALISSDSDSINDVARVYVDFGKEFHGVVTLSAYDVTGFKMGDCKMPIDANAGDALYFDFHFDKRVDIQQDTKMVLW